jgi:hypothetical protein
MSEAKENPLLSKMKNVIQGTTIGLPSKGLFYDNGELEEGVVNGEIVLYPMTTLDEIIIRTPDMLLQGTAIEKVLLRCAPAIKKPADLFFRDIDYILVMLRLISYGDKTTIPVQCPSCLTDAEEGEVVPHIEYPISMDHFIKKSKALELEDIEKNYVLTLSNSMVIYLRPSKYAEMMNMYKINDDSKSSEEIEEAITTSILAVIKRVDDVSDREFIKEWLKQLPITLMREIIARISEANNWGLDFSYNITCKDCKTKHNISYILNPVSFFTLPSSQEIERSSKS